MKILRRSALLLSLFLLPCTLLAQASTGSLVGTVTSEGKALPGVTVSVIGRVTPAGVVDFFLPVPNKKMPTFMQPSAVTAESGRYSIPDLPSGEYKVRFELSGMQTVFKPVKIKVSETSRADVDLVSTTSPASVDLKVAQAATTGSLVGTVTSEGKALPGVTVYATAPAPPGADKMLIDVVPIGTGQYEIMRSDVTGGSGGYSIPDLPPGKYTVTFELTRDQLQRARLPGRGMQPVVESVTVNASKTSRADVDLKVEPVISSEAVVIILIVALCVAVLVTATKILLDGAQVGKVSRLYGCAFLLSATVALVVLALLSVGALEIYLYAAAGAQGRYYIGVMSGEKDLGVWLNVIAAITLTGLGSGVVFYATDRIREHWNRGAAAGDFAARRRWEARRALSARFLAVAALALLAIGVGGLVWVQVRQAKEDDARDRAKAKEDARDRAEAKEITARARFAGFKKDCALGEGASCFQVGVMYEQSQGVARDFAQAAAFYRKACELHYGMGCQYLGDSYMHGQGVARDEVRGRVLYAEAAALLDDSCARGEAYSCYALGLMYRVGQGIAVDARRARGLLDQACRGGNNDACVALRAPQ